MSDFAVPLPIPDVATALAEAHAASQWLFEFLIDDDVNLLREDTIQAQLFDSDARDATAIGGGGSDLERGLPGAAVVFITIEQTINHALGLTAGS